MSNIINFEDYKKKTEGGFAPVSVYEQRETILLQQEEIAKQKKFIISLLDSRDD